MLDSKCKRRISAGNSTLIFCSSQISDALSLTKTEIRLEVLCMSYSQSTEFLGKEKISKLMLKFCIPCVLSLLISALYNIVDQIFIGNSELSTLGNAATGVVFPIFIIAQGVAWYFGDGSAAYINIHQGKGDTDKIHIWRRHRYDAYMHSERLFTGRILSFENAGSVFVRCVGKYNRLCDRIF